MTTASTSRYIIAYKLDQNIFFYETATSMFDY